MKMGSEEYFKRYGVLYGESYRDNGEICYITEFDNLKDAREWLNTEEYDFRTRDFITATEARALGYIDR